MTSFLTTLPSTPFAIAMPDEFSDATDIIGDRRYLISFESNDATGEYKASECTELYSRHTWLCKQN